MNPSRTFRVVQPWGKDRGRESTTLSTHRSVQEAFRYIDDLSAQMMRTGARSDFIELVVVDDDGNLIPRPATH